MTAALAPAPAAPARRRRHTWVAIFMRLLAIQGSWNYETLIGNGIGFCVEPALRLLPGGVHGDAFKAALARQSAYFNAHPYLASVAVGALARAELDGEPPERIERFRTALCGPLGSVGDRLVWAGWLPFCSLGVWLLRARGAAPLAVVLFFLVLYNAGHLALRVWGLHVGWTRGLASRPRSAIPCCGGGRQTSGAPRRSRRAWRRPARARRILGHPAACIGVVLARRACSPRRSFGCMAVSKAGAVALVLLAVFALISVIR